MVEPPACELERQQVPKRGKKKTASTLLYIQSLMIPSRVFVQIYHPVDVFTDHDKQM